jgi:hypothetical protein
VHGKRFYFDHEEASWLIQAGSDILHRDTILQIHSILFYSFIGVYSLKAIALLNLAVNLLEIITTLYVLFQ